MAAPHIPAWLQDVVANLVSLHDAEAVFLVGAHARGNPERATAIELLLAVDNATIPERGIAPAYRWETVDGFPAPVRYLRTSLAELMAGAYGASAAWVDVLRSAHPLHDPLDYRRRLEAHASAVRAPGSATAIAVARESAGHARQLLNAGSLAASHLVATRAADALASWLAEGQEKPSTNPVDVVEAVVLLSRGAARGFSEVLLATSPAEAVAALETFIEAVESSLRLRTGA